MKILILNHDLNRARQQAAPLSIKKNIFIVIKFKKKDIKLYLAAPEPPEMAPVMPCVAGPWSKMSTQQEVKKKILQAIT